NDGTALTRDPAHPQNRDFTAEKTGDVLHLTIFAVNLDHSGTYYCAYWDYHSNTESLNHNTKTSTRLNHSFCTT
ncbi:hypothetical protein GN956_G27355, partial [Arapaima gigas]